MTNPLISLITPAYRSNLNYLDELVDCIAPFQNEIEWVIVNDDPGNSQLNEYFLQLEKRIRFKYVKNSKNLGITAGYCAGVKEASSPYLGIMDHDDLLDPKPILDAVKKYPDYDLIYSDEYKFEGTHKEKYTKPGFDLLSSAFYFYTHHITLFRTERVKKLLDCDPYVEFPTLFDIWLNSNYLKNSDLKNFKAAHVPSLSYGWRVHSNSTAADLSIRPANTEERLKVVQDFFKNFGESAQLSVCPHATYLVTGYFASPADELNVPSIQLLRTQPNAALSSWIKNLDKLDSKENISAHWLGQLNLNSQVDVLKTLHSIPLKYLFHISDKPHLILSKDCYPKLANQPDMRHHADLIPFFIDLEPKKIIEYELSGLTISKNTYREDGGSNLIRCVIVKGE